MRFAGIENAGSPRNLEYQENRALLPHVNMNESLHTALSSFES